MHTCSVLTLPAHLTGEPSRATSNRIS
jgi:hypothetical protein